MCWSLEVSILSWVIGMFSGIWLLKRKQKNDIILAYLIFTYAQMQLAEALMWLDPNCGKINKIGTYIAYFSLWLHPLVIGLGIYKVYKIKLPMILGLAIFLFGIGRLLKIKSIECSKVTPCSDKHIVWGFNPSFYLAIFAVAIAFCLFYIRPFNYALIASSFYVITWLLSFLLSPIASVGSYWCWTTCFFSILVIIGTYKL